ncbi:MAG TPA: RluA family pseudouridine synthase, partial [Spirochaetia bacterium]|nr:RluA family pseudouridine synthase [Spirochaetia bacterium]
MNEISAIVDEGHHGLRVDRYVSDVLGVCSRSQLKQREVEVSINGKPAKLSRQVKGGDSLTVRYSP